MSAWIAAMGACGIGLVWGWLVAARTSSLLRPVQTSLALIAATVLLGAEVWWIARLPAVVLFPASALLTCWLHLNWRRELKARRQ
jgi:hypothetical protein